MALRLPTLACLLALATTPAPAAAPVPEFLPLAGSKHPAQAKNGPVMRSAAAPPSAAPLSREVRAGPGPDGRIEIRCRERPNPQREDADRHAGPGPQR